LAADVPPGERLWTSVCPASRLAEQTFVCARVGKAEVLLIRDGDRVVACERVCPHEQADLSGGHLSNGRLSCPRHAASFDLADGTISAGWPSRPLKIYPVRIVEGHVWIDVQALG
jgi:3-phenylpropionate/trans-cinnamate dioxygenase ferredoxin component